MKKRLFSVFIAFVLVVAAALAQDGPAAQAADDIVYIQVEARTSLASAQDSVRDYAGRLPDVNGFALGGGWYGIALGPYTRAQAQAQLNALLQSGSIPADSYLEVYTAFGQQFWPVGARNDGAPVVPVPQVTSDPAAQPAPTPQPVPQADPVAEAAEVDPAPAAPEIPEETVQEARASERALTREERDMLQIALKWAGFYDGGIDGAFGPGTRASMSRWQEANNFDPTGVLSTRQRAELLRQYNAVLEGMDMQLVQDAQAGIAMQMPLGVVAFDRYESPFAIYKPKTDMGARVILVSQPGDSTSLAGLYEIMQTLEIIPVEGERKRDARGFNITGANDRIVSHFEVGLQNGEIKGFGLVWPAGDEERRSRVLKIMQDSYARLDGVLDPAQVTDDGQAVDLVSGLKVRTAKASATGFFIEARGTVLTSAALIAGCERVTLNGVHDARVLAVDEALGIAVLTPRDRLAPRRVAQFRSGELRLQSEVAVAGFSFGGVLTAPTLTFGTLEDLRGLGGEDKVKRLALSALPGDVGGPVFDAGGTVLGMLLPKETPGGRVLPEEVSFAAKGDMILDFLRNNGIQPVSRGGLSPLAPEDLTAQAAEMTVLVSCWE
ncbi:serine protease [Mameliella sediminis]|uniref:serine protease n=1 Tax=Mameliella sediminis TaxID=2836866 RepID=UPI001C472A2A|nr:serine protease [Mameliella sediminis]MBV7393818.1 trypsin-like peptidase domain-containing protein [Mameliella sediminis]MBY6116516.1 trypsin-like peptidase domain-containing protein [Antarctobacter heliothermus]MBY6145458.1 trypsin-like peptidase domain-containing protein [Mameliella alba]MCA0955466.1 trypsin-like peptidase domain-containing protein [Mameliella alba]